MSLPSSKAEEVLAFCLRDESAEMKTKVYEILSLSEINVNDPMFLVLALTGQIRVFLESAPKDLRELLFEGKASLEQYIEELHRAIVDVKDAQQQQVTQIKQNVEEINRENASNLRVLHQSLVAEILESNSEVENKVCSVVEEIKTIQDQLIAINVKLQDERNTNIKVIKSLIEGMNKTTKELELANAHITSSVTTLDRLKLSKFVNKGMIIGAFTSVFIFGSLLTLGLIKLVNAKSVGSIPSNLIVEVSKQYYC